MARYAQLVATGLPSGVLVTVKQNGVQVPNLFPSADAQAPDNRPRTADSSGALFPTTYVPNGTYSVAWSGGSTSVTVSGASGLPEASPFDMATQTELDDIESDAAGTFASIADLDALEASVQAIAVNHGLPGDVAPPPVFGAATATARTLVAARVNLVRFVPGRDRSLTLAAFSVQTAATVNDPVEVGIYSASSTTLTRVATSGQVTSKLNATGLKTVPLVAGVTPGTVYYAAIAAATVGGTVPQVAAVQTITADSWLMYGSGSPNAGQGFIDGVLSGGLLPATITAASVNWGTVSTAPVVVLRES